MLRILNKLTGEYRFIIPAEHTVLFLNSAVSMNIKIYADKKTNDKFVFFASAKEKSKIFYICNSNSIELELSCILGLPGVLVRYRRRYGVFLGLALFLACVFISRYFIWDISVVGNESVSDESIVLVLEELGCTYGAFIPMLDFEMIANDFLLRSDDIAWISVNMRSSLAVVEVKERIKGEPVMDHENLDGRYSNIVASEDGEIVLPQIVSGKSTVSPGDIVRRGSLLATGVINVKDEEVRYEYAFGSVFAKVYREIAVEVPFVYEEKNYTGRRECNKFVKFFGKRKNLFENRSIEYIKYDKIYDEQQLILFDSITLPVWYGSTVFAEYSYEITERSESEARAKAQIDFSEEIKALLSEGEIVSIEREETLLDDRLILTGRLYLVKDIAAGCDFTVSDT